MSHHNQSHNQEMQQCIQVCQQCHSVCLQTLTYCLQAGGHHAQAAHIMFLLGCAEICQTSANFMLRGSDLHAEICRACAVVCQRCAESCEQFGNDTQMQTCAQACRRCAESCQRMAAMQMGT